MSDKTSLQKQTPGSLHPAGSAASCELEVVPKCVTTLAEAYEKGMIVMGGRRAGRTLAMRIATAKPHQKQLGTEAANAPDQRPGATKV